jgi:hypothetical protein
MNTDPTITDDPLQQVAHAARQFGVAQAVRDEAVRRRDEAIRAAVAAGRSYRSVAKAAGIAHTRVRTIVKEGNDA